SVRPLSNSVPAQAPSLPLVPFRCGIHGRRDVARAFPARSKACPSAATSPRYPANALSIDGIHVLDPPTHPAAFVLRLVRETSEGARVLPFPASPLAAPTHKDL